MSILVALRFLFVTPTPLICFNHLVISQICRRQSLLKGSVPRTFALGGDKRDRTADPLLAKQVLSQLSYTPISLRVRTLKIKQRFLYFRNLTLD